MIMSWIWLLFLTVSLFCSLMRGEGAALGASVLQGAQDGVTLAISMAGSLCLWSGVGRLLSASGVSGFLAGLLRPVLYRVFPSSGKDPALAEALSENICANILGLGNAATPPGIRAAKRLRCGTEATEELCRLVVLNTASIQLIPANVAAIRISLGCETPFDILPAVWITSICSAGLGLLAAWGLGRLRSA